MKLWRYVIRFDHGVAPNYDGPLTTLTICKPKIRKGAQPGDVIVAFACVNLAPVSGAAWKRNDVVWAGIVSEKLSLSEYWFDPRFDGKKPSADALHPDNIYEPNGLRLKQVANPSYGQDTAERDKRGVYSLVMSPAWHFKPGQLEMTEDSGLRMDPFNRRGHRVSDIDEATKAALVAWLSGAPLDHKKFKSSVSV